MAPPAEVGSHDGLAYSLWLPEGRPRAGVVIVHGANSSKESHHDYARAARGAGLAAIAFDQRGHGDSEGELDGRIIDDVAAIAQLLPTPWFALRGSSLGGYVAIVAAARAGASAVVAVCPAGAGHLQRLLRSDEIAFRADVPALERFLAEHDDDEALAALEIPVMLMHAEGDESVPVEHSRALAARFGHPASRLVEVPGGHHRSVQHDGELQGISLSFIARAADGAQGEEGRVGPP
jgi:pimeloyl-ACP methyl ester carboxylesterase